MNSNSPLRLISALILAMTSACAVEQAPPVDDWEPVTADVPMAAPIFDAHISRSSTPNPDMATGCVHADEEAWLHVPATAGDLVHGILSESGTGAGPCSSRLGLCADILAPITYLGNAVVEGEVGDDGLDYGSIPFLIDGGAVVGAQMWIQGGIEDGSDSEISFVVQVEVCADSGYGSGTGSGSEPAGGWF